MSTTFRPIILIGAARSGTKLVRDIIGLHPQVDVVPYDINYVWRMGNERHPHDELTPSMLDDQIRRRIRQQIAAYSTGKPFLIEKTVGNCLRVPFVHALFPDALLLHLIRDGRDVVESAYRQWLAKPDWRYILQKAQTFPVTAAPRYALNYGLQTIRRLFHAETKEPATWGPLYAGIADDCKTKSVLEVCALQWRNSVLKSIDGFSEIPSSAVHTVCYEDFVREPSRVMAGIAEFAGLDMAEFDNGIWSSITPGNIGKGFRSLTSKEQADVLSVISPLLARLGYL